MTHGDDFVITESTNRLADLKDKLADVNLIKETVVGRQTCGSQTVKIRIGRRNGYP